MKDAKKIIIGILLLLLLFMAITEFTSENAVENEETQEYTIGVAVYDPESSEMKMFMKYYQDYLTEGFPVKFYFSEQLSSAADENEFIVSMKEIGAQGIISFLGQDVPNTVGICEENEIYYVLGSNTISDEDYEAVKANPWFLGTVGPNQEAVYQAGRDMASYFIEKGGKSYVIMTGGASKNNALHALRTQGMLEVLQEQLGVVLNEDAESLAVTPDSITLYDENRTVSVTLCPDYTEGGEGLTNLEKVFAEGTCDVLMSAFHASTYLDKISEKEAAQQQNIFVGAIDSFSEENFEAIKNEDAFGNPSIDYVQGKYASLAGPAFAMLYNAMSGHPETNSADGYAVRLYNGFWTAKGQDEYNELYSYTSGIYENAYSCENLMQVIKVFNEDASPEKLKELTEAYTVEAVKDRILK